EQQGTAERRSDDTRAVRRRHSLRASSRIPRRPAAALGHTLRVPERWFVAGVRKHPVRIAPSEVEPPWVHTVETALVTDDIIRRPDNRSRHAYGHGVLRNVVAYEAH